MLKNKIYKHLEEREQEIIQLRRYLHQNAEPSFKEFKTAEYIKNFYGKYKNGVEVRYPVGLHGVTIKIKGGQPGRTLALRADFDALELTEETGVEYSSKNPGVMHACGHDAHTAVLLIVADTLIKFREELCGDIVIIHQYAEEVSPGGAKAMVDDGALAGADAVVGGHVWGTAYKTGEIAVRSGMAMAGRSYFKTTITGSGGHGSQPHSCIDPIVAASHFVVAVQSILGRNINPLDPAVVTIGRFEGLGSFNIIPGSAVLEGDTRYFSEDVKLLLEKRFKEILEGITAAHGCSFELDYRHDYAATVNDAKLAEFARKFIEADTGPGLKLRESEPIMGSEDFSCYQTQAPGLYVFFGASPKNKNGEVYPHHHPKFNIDETCLVKCAKFYAGFAVDFLENYS